MKEYFKQRLALLSKLSVLFDRKEKLQFAFIMVIALVAALFQALGVVSVLPFIELVMDSERALENKWVQAAFTSLGFENTLSFTMAAGFVVLGILVVGNSVSAAAMWLRLRFVWEKNHTISLKLLEQYLAMPYVYFLNQHSADLSKNILFEVQQLTSRFLQPILVLLANGATVLVIIALLFFVHPAATLAAGLLFGFSYSAVFLLMKKSLQVKGEQRLQENAARSTVVGESLAGIKDIRVFGREREFLDRFSRHSERFSVFQAWSNVAVQLPRYVLEVVAFGGVIVLILFFLAVDQGRDTIIPLVGFFAFAGYRLMPALQGVFHSISEMHFNAAIINTIAKDIRGTGKVHPLFENEFLPEPIPFKEQITFKQVSFQYPFAKEVSLHEINLTIPKGSFVGFVGPTGGGKTTFVDILIGLLFPSAGRIMVDGVKIDEANVRNWQRNIGYVPQQIFLSDDTIARNVALGLPDEKIDKKRVELVCVMAGLHDFIKQELPQSYDTLIGERGVRLSGGQRQRIGIARALYHDPEVLVLDEATSSLDGVTEKAVLDALENIAKKKTIITVAHRLTTVKNCHKIYLLAKGAIVAAGTHEELLKNNAQFQEMAKGYG